MEKRVILAFVLSFAVLYAFRALYSPPPASEPAPTEQSTPAVPANKPSPAPLPNQPEQKTGAPGSASTPATTPPPAQDLHAEKSEDFVMETPLYVATFSNVGGVLRSIKLKMYTDGEGHPLELIDEKSGTRVGWPLSITTGDQKVDEEVNRAQFVGRKDGESLSLEFAGNGIHARKILQFDPANYVFSLQTSLTKDGKPVPHYIDWRGGFGDQSIPQDPAKKNAVYQTDSAFKRVNLRGMKDQEQAFTTVRGGVDDQYFLGIFLMLDNPVQLKVRKQEYPGPDAKTQIPALWVSALVPEDRPFRVYVGPKQRDWLSKADPPLGGALDYGYFEFIARPLVFCLLWIHSYIGNFGWAIILLTIVLNTVM